MVIVERARAEPRATRRELLVTWAQCIGGIALAKLVSLVDPTGLIGGNLAGVAAFLFIALPERRLLQHHERWRDYGLPWWGLRDARTWRAWRRGWVVGLAVCALLFPIFFGIFWTYAQVLPHLPDWIARAVAPYYLPSGPTFQLPDRFGLLVLNQFVVVALPEELFYRGWMQTSWAATRPSRNVRVLGATLGAGFLATQGLFAAGHLVVLEVWRLGTFFPGLLFGWLRARTGDLSAPVVVHALSNIFIAILEASFYG